MPGVKPFVEAGADRREHDLALDRNGMQRDSNGDYVKGGTTFELSRILTGDVASAGSRATTRIRRCRMSRASRSMRR